MSIENERKKEKENTKGIKTDNITKENARDRNVSTRSYCVGDGVFILTCIFFPSFIEEK